MREGERNRDEREGNRENESERGTEMRGEREEER